MRIVIVGPCAAGKTTLAGNLAARGYDAHDCAQEHSQVQTMWQRIGKPDVLIYLDASPSTIHARLKVDWEASYIGELYRRLGHARSHADLYLDTNPLSEEQVLQRVLAFLDPIAPSRAQGGERA